MSNPERIYICVASVPQALKDGEGIYYANYTGDPERFNLAAYVPESRIREEREAAWKDAIQATKDAQMRVGASRNCYDAPDEAEGVAKYMLDRIVAAAARLRGD